MRPEQGTLISTSHKGRQGAGHLGQSVPQQRTHQLPPRIGFSWIKQPCRFTDQSQAGYRHLQLLLQRLRGYRQGGQTITQLGDGIQLQALARRAEACNQLHRYSGVCIIRLREPQPLLHGLRPGREDRHTAAQAIHGLLQRGTGSLVELINLRHIEGLLEHTPTGSDQHQIVIDEGCGQRLGVLAKQGAAATDQAHAAIAADLQIRASQAAALPETLQKTASTFTVAAAQGQHPTGLLLGRRRCE